MVEKSKINIQLVSSANVEDPVLLVPNDETHPFTFAAMNDALIIKFDDEKMEEYPGGEVK